ncbi:hypothetical protein BgAZ_108020 [Babesia gibsoni]|uniref:Uncharacterized protein n=1 Tax=Babesia gibsoni TaxID=33632 RepID=A0AAD8UTW1_BABGI|nr:hypothetical protein BgAZ_108020 [Babesia gibsoni]
MRGSNAANLKRVLSLPISQRETGLLRAYQPIERRLPYSLTLDVAGSHKNSNCQGVVSNDAIKTSRNHPPKEGTVMHANKRDSHSGTQRHKMTEGRSETANGKSVTNCRIVPSASVTLSLGRKSHVEPLSRWADISSLNYSFDRSDIGHSVLSIGGMDAPSVEKCMERDILKNVFNLPEPRLRVWLHNLDATTLLQETLSYLFNENHVKEKLTIAYSVVCKKLDNVEFLTCKQSYMFLKLQLILLERKVTFEFSRSLYGMCINLLDWKIGKLPPEYLFNICTVLYKLWHHLQSTGRLGEVKEYHESEGDTADMRSLCNPLVGILESSVLEINDHSIPALVKLLHRLQQHVPIEALAKLHEISFLKIIEHVETMTLHHLMKTLKYVEKLNSQIPLPLYFLCAEILKKQKNSVSYEDYSFLMRCMSRCNSYELTSVKRALLLYASFAESSKNIEVSKLEPFVVVTLFNAFGIIPATEEAELEMKKLLTSELHTDTPPNLLAEVRLPKGYYKKVSSLEEMRYIIIQSLGYLLNPKDSFVSQILHPSHIKTCYGVTRRLKLSLLEIIEEVRTKKIVTKELMIK